MRAEVVWTTEHLHRGCRLARGVGEVFHAPVDGAPCDVEVPLASKPIPAGWEPLAIGSNGMTAILMGPGGRLATWDFGSHDLQAFSTAGFNDGLGRSACEVEPGRFLLLEAIHGLSIIEVSRKKTYLRNDVGALRRFESACSNVTYWGGLATSVSAYGGLIAVGGFQLDRVVLLGADGHLRRHVGPEFQYRGETFGFARNHPNTVSPFGVAGVFVDLARRIWVAHDAHEMSVFTESGECLWMSAPDEWDSSEFTGPNFSWDWGVDARGWLWCHGGECAFTVPELGALHLAPSIQNLPPARSGLEPTLGDES